MSDMPHKICSHFNCAVVCLIISCSIELVSAWCYLILLMLCCVYVVRGRTGESKGSVAKRQHVLPVETSPNVFEGSSGVAVKITTIPEQ